ncbi:MAG: SPOR domain-containing protein [Alphaproteobacteria bacterium]|nr:SPOR domain-containing protein [Alphaproteobacteria bacterium]
MYQDFFNKNDGYLDDFKQKVAEQKIASIEERRDELVRSRNNFLGTFAGIALAGVVGWFVLIPQYQQVNKEIPIIRRPQSAVKIKPENPGGMEIPNQDKDVYNIVEKKDVDTTVVENLLPTPEQPKLPDIIPDETQIDENAQNIDELVDEVVDEAAENTAQIADNAVPNKPEDLLAEPKEQDNGAQEAKAEAKEATQTESAKAVEPVAEPAKPAEPVKTAEPVAKAQTVADGKWQIQLIASKNKGAVEKSWKTWSAKYSLLQSMNHEIQPVDLGTQGTIYRLRVGSFADKAAAQNACAALKAQGLSDCIAKER